MNRSSGFTLIELMLTIAILSIVFSFAFPAMAELAARHRAEERGRELFELIALARAKAYSEGRVYTLCASENGMSCGEDWSRGALLFADSNGNGKLDSGEKIERILRSVPAGASLQWNPSATGKKKYLQYRPNGRAPWQNGNFAYCPPDANVKHGWFIVLNATGRPYFGRRGSDGIARNGSGKALQC